MLEDLLYKHSLRRFYYWYDKLKNERRSSDDTVKKNYYDLAVTFGKKAKKYELANGLKDTKLQIDLTRIIIHYKME